MTSEISSVVRHWVTPKLPREHIFVSPEKRPKGLYQLFRVYTRKWFVHPIKRRLAKYYLFILQNFLGMKVIGITGSAGKTTTKEMTASILGQLGKTVSSFANIDPVYNIPTTILNCSPSTRYLVLEMGIEYPGEMNFYLWLAKPDIGVITNIGITHTLFLKNIEGVIREKRKLVKHLSKDSYAVLNAEDRYLRQIGKNLKAKVVWFGEGSSVSAEGIKNGMAGAKYTLVIDKNKINVHLPAIGKQTVANSLAAAAVGKFCGASLTQIKKGIESFKPQEHRMEVLRHKSGATILDDSYNSNPKAAEESLKTLVELAGNSKKVAVLGDMLELGDYEKRAHQKLGKTAAFLGIDYLIGVGEASRELVREASRKMGAKRTFWSLEFSQIPKVLKPLLRKRTYVLVKGSRAIGLDKLISQLL